MAGVTVEQGLLKGMCGDYRSHGNCFTFGDGGSVMCLSPRDGVQILRLKEDSNCLMGTYRVTCPDGCRLREFVDGLRVNHLGQRVELTNVVVAR